MQPARGAKLLELLPPLREPQARHFLEIAFQRLVRRHFEMRKDVLFFFQMDVGALGNFERPRERFGNFREHGGHLFVGLEIELVRGEFHVR